MSPSVRLSAALVLSSLLSMLTGVGTAAAADVTVEGMVRTLAAEPVPGAGAGAPHEETYQQVLQVNGQTYFLEGAQASDNGPVRATGVVDGQEFIASSVVSTGTLAAIPTTGDTRTLVMLAYWTQPDGMTPTWAYNQVFGDSAAWFREASYGRMSQSGDVTPWLQIAGPTTGCYSDHQMLMAQARAAAVAQGYNPTAYGNHVLYFPACGGDAAWYSGWAYVGSTGTWLNGYLDRRVVTHEIGHNLGLWHSNSNLCSDGGLAGTCSFSEYGDDYDAMGSSNHVAHFSASQKAALGWLDGRTVDLSAGGRAALAPMSAVDAGTPQAAVMSMPSGRRYWLEYRRAVGFDAWLPGGATDGVLVHATGSGSGSLNNAPSLLDVSPGDGISVATATLKSGQTWASPDGAWVRVGDVTSTGATVITGIGTPPADAPGLVTGFGLSEDDAAGTATVTWAPPVDDGGSPVTGYRVSRTGANAEPWSTVLPVSARSHTFGDLRAGDVYTLRVQAVNAVGVGAAASGTAAIPVATVPGAPTTAAVTIDVKARSAVMTWAPPASTGGSAITGYKVSRDGADVNGAGPWTTTLPATARSQTFTRLAPGSTYTFTVQAINAAGAGTAGSSTATLITVAGAPTNLTVTQDAAARTATIRWAPPSQNTGAAVVGYWVRRDGVNSLGSASWGTGLPATARSQTFTNLVPGTTYTFRVWAANAAGSGTPSSVVTEVPRL